MFGLRVFCCCIFVLALGDCELFVPFYPQDHDVESNPWVGEWHVESIDGDGTWQAEFTIEVEHTNSYQFYGRYWFPFLRG